MKIILLAAMLLAFSTCTTSYPCQGSSSCCTGGGSSCCTGGGSSCCIGGGSSCCTGGGSSCCSQSCCRQTTTCVQNPTPPNPVIATTSSPLTVGPPRPLVETTGSNPSTVHSNSNNNNNNNTIIIPTNITIQNELRSETHITVPVSVDVNNVNNIDIRESSKSTEGPSTEGPSTEGPIDVRMESGNQTAGNVTVIRVPDPVPVYRHIPVVYTVIIPQIVPVPVGCCQVIQPCMPYTHCGCQSSSMDCSHHCSGSHMYHGINVCQGGCTRRDTSMGIHCGYGGCSMGHVDCSTCGSDFYNSYDSFMRCSGCFMPTSWGMGGGGSIWG